MLVPVRSSRFKRDARKAERRGKDLDKLEALLTLLIHQERLPERYRDHPLRGKLRDYREAHIEPDWLMIYGVRGDELHLVRTGSHSDLFDEQVTRRSGKRMRSQDSERASSPGPGVR